jgi:hypothetical protein
MPCITIFEKCWEGNLAGLLYDLPVCRDGLHFQQEGVVAYLTQQTPMAPSRDGSPSASLTSEGVALPMQGELNQVTLLSY